MNSPARRPTFFLSSTIFDFADLRSAIKFHLEQRGSTVLASEFNDFRKPLDTHSYEACLTSIEQADYFVLMIGSRVGGWFDEKARVSITQQEYRKAYELHQAGRLRIITLVRQDVWSFRESQKALARHLKSLEIEAEAAATIARFPNKFAEDAAFIIGFIEEVGRNQQTKAALASSTALPTGNWIHVINSFRDVADVLNSVLLAGLPVEEIAFRRALRHELLEVLRACLLKTSDGVFGPRRHIEHFWNKLVIGDRNPNSRVRVTTEDWDAFASVMVGLMGRKLHVALLPQALASPTFLAFDSTAGAFLETPVFSALHQLREEVRQADQHITEGALNAMFLHTPDMRLGPKSDTLDLPFLDIVPLVSLALRWANVVELSVAIIAHLDGGDFEAPTLLPTSPIRGLDEKLAMEEATPSEAIRYVAARRAKR